MECSLAQRARVAMTEMRHESLLGHASKTKRDPLVGSQVDENDVRAFVEYTQPNFFGSYTSILAATFGNFEPRFERFGSDAARFRRTKDRAGFRLANPMACAGG